MDVHVVGGHPEPAKEAAPYEEAAPGEALVPEALEALGEELGGARALHPHALADEVYREVQDRPVRAEPRNEEGRVVVHQLLEKSSENLIFRA